jgi:uncharacterized damage-inducible protein DinB
MSSLKPLIKQYQVLSGWFLSVLEGIDDKDGAKTVSENTNSLEWLAGHLITGRYRNINRLGNPIAPYNYLDKFINQTLPPPNAIAFNKSIQYPTLTESRQQWNKYTDMFLKRLNSIDETALKTVMPFTLPTGGNTIEDALVFMVLHETYHIGQMSIIRKAIGYPGMKLGLKKV